MTKLATVCTFEKSSKNFYTDNGEIATKGWKLIKIEIKQESRENGDYNISSKECEGVMHLDDWIGDIDNEKEYRHELFVWVKNMIKIYGFDIEVKIDPNFKEMYHLDKLENMPQNTKFRYQHGMIYGY